jgi:hypothetical protein
MMPELLAELAIVRAGMGFFEFAIRFISTTDGRALPN